MKNKSKIQRSPVRLRMPAHLSQRVLEEGWPGDQTQLDRPLLRFSPTAWAKLLYFRDKSENEVGGFGISKPDDLLCVTDFVTVRQQVTTVSVSLDDQAVADFFDEQVDLGRKPEEFARVWCHTHPDMSPQPSSVDENTFHRVFGQCQWAVMLILARDERTYARLCFNVGPGGQMPVPVKIDYAVGFGPSDHPTWDAEYHANIRADTPTPGQLEAAEVASGGRRGDFEPTYDLLAELEDMEAAERQLFLDELAERPELWNSESEDPIL
jgi:proteasome lid subunit RPN8/RPN11